MVPSTSLPQIKDNFAINLIENRQHELLFLKRSRDSKIGPELWGFPAGHMQTGESPEQCSLRELREEIGSNYKINLVNQFGPIRDSFYGGIYNIFLFHCQWLFGTINLNHEHSDYAWVSKDEYQHYSVVDGVDEDINYLEIWPEKYLNRDKLPGKDH